MDNGRRVSVWHNGEAIFPDMSIFTVAHFDFNAKAFINASTMSDEEVLAVVRRIDEDDDLWMQMVSEPARTMAQIEQEAADLQKCRAFSGKIFYDRPLDEKKRTATCYFNNVHRAYWHKDNLIQRILSRLKDKQP